MTSFCKTYLLSFALLLLLGSVAAPQGGPSREGPVAQGRTELEMTQQLIERAEEPIKASGSPVAQAALERARELQKRAWDRFGESTALGYAAAHILTLQAREQVRIALNNARQTQQNEGIVLNRLERAEEKLARARDLIDQSDNASLDALLESARRNLARGWEFYRNREYRAALKMAEQVEAAAEKLLGFGAPGMDGGQNFERRRENVDALLVQVQELISDCSSSTAQAYLDQGLKNIELADDLFRKNRRPAALGALKHARDMALKAAQDCHRGGSGQLKGHYDRLHERADQLRELLPSLAEPKRTTVDRLLEQASVQLELGLKALDRNQFEKALVSLHAANLALRRADAETSQTK